MRQQIPTICNYCSNEFIAYRKGAKWCSRTCDNKAKRRVLNKKCPECSISIIDIAVKCRGCASKSHEHYWGDRISKSKLGKPINATNMRRGENHPWWKGGTSQQRQRERWTSKYKWWRISVFKRDDYMCVHCGIRGGRLEADHIIPWAVSEQHRYDINNGRTLCHDCHVKTPSYGARFDLNYNYELSV